MAHKSKVIDSMTWKAYLCSNIASVDVDGIFSFCFYFLGLALGLVKCLTQIAVWNTRKLCPDFTAMAGMWRVLTYLWETLFLVLYSFFRVDAACHHNFCHKGSFQYLLDLAVLEQCFLLSRPLQFYPELITKVGSNGLSYSCWVYLVIFKTFLAKTL